MNPTLTHNGLRIDMGKLTKNDRKKIVKDLTVKPQSYIGVENSYILFEWDKKFAYLPRFYGITKFASGDKKNCKNLLMPGEIAKFSFKNPNFQLQDIQKITYNYVLNSLNKTGTAIIKLGCGVGKTVLSIFIAQKLGKKSLIILHRLTLMHQWKKEIEKFTDAKVGLLHGKTIDYEDKDIILTTVHNVINKNTKEFRDIYKRINITFIDECHHYSAEKFCETLKIINSNYVVGLTATPNKGEKVKIDHVFKQFIGPIVPPDNELAKFTTKNENKGNVIVNFVRYEIDGGELSEHLIHDFIGKPNVSGMVTNIGKNIDRTTVCANILSDIIKDNQRHILVVSDRKAQLKKLYFMLSKAKISCGLYIGGLTTTELEEAKKTKILLGTYPICEEGLNVPSINTLLILSPRRECEQMVGRALRMQHQIPVLIIDVVDAFSKTFVNQGYARGQYYKSKGYIINKVKVSDINNIPPLQITINSPQNLGENSSNEDSSSNEESEEEQTDDFVINS